MKNRDKWLIFSVVTGETHIIKTVKEYPDRTVPPNVRGENIPTLCGSSIPVTKQQYRARILFDRPTCSECKKQEKV